MNRKAIPISISVGALILAILHVVWPDIGIDGSTIALIIIAIIPWLGSIIKSLELPGGWKVEYHDLQKAMQKADRAGLLPESLRESTQPYSFQIVATEDANLALAGLRIEIEKRLIQLAEARKIAVPPRSSVRKLLRLLCERNILSKEEQTVLLDMIGLLNSAVHGASVSENAADWAIDVGPRLLQALEDILGE